MQSSAAISKSTGNSYRHPQLPSHLYNRAGIFYFRLVLTETLRLRFGRVEIRLSLRTAYRRRALDLSRRLYVYFYEMVGNEPMLTYKELKRRLNIHLQRQLESEQMNIHTHPLGKDYFAVAREHPDYSETDIFRHLVESLQKVVNDPEALSARAEAAIEEMAYWNILLPIEVRKNDHLQLAKAFLQSKVTFYRLLEKRRQGDYITEDPIISADFGRLPRELTLEEEFAQIVRETKKKAVRAAAKANPPSTEPEQVEPEKTEPAPQPQATPSMLYSEAIQLFIKDKINEGSWKPHMVREHEGHLQFFADIMGDMELVKINRAVMRQYREILFKLPPNYSRSPEYKGKTVAEILEMAPKQVLSVKRFNTLIQAVSSLMEWLVREEIMASNPAKDLQRKEERQAIELRDPFEKKDFEKIFGSSD